MATKHPRFGELLTSREVSDLTGYTMNQLRNFRQRMESAPFGHVRQGGTSWYVKSEIMTWLEGQDEELSKYIPAGQGFQKPPGSGSVPTSKSDDNSSDTFEFPSLSHETLEGVLGRKLMGNLNVCFVTEFDSESLIDYSSLDVQVGAVYEFGSVSDTDLWFEERLSWGTIQPVVSKRLIAQLLDVVSHFQGQGYFFSPNDLGRALADEDLKTYSEYLEDFLVPRQVSLNVLIRFPDGKLRRAMAARFIGTRLRDNRENGYGYISDELRQATEPGYSTEFWGD